MSSHSKNVSKITHSDRTHGDVISIASNHKRKSVSVVHETSTIGEIAREFGLTLRALRFYENKGLLSPRREGVNRLYDSKDRGRIALILQGKRLGFPLSEIKRMIAAKEGGDPQGLSLTQEKCAAQIEALEKQKREIDAAIAELRGIQTSLNQPRAGRTEVVS